MKILFTCDQVRALKLGIDCPHSTALIDIDPALLSEEERNLLAEYLTTDAKANKFLSGGKGTLTIVKPTVDGVIEALRSTLAWVKQQEQEQLDRCRAEVIEKLGTDSDYLRGVCPPDLREQWEAHCAKIAESKKLVEEKRRVEQQAKREADQKITDSYRSRLPSEFLERRAAGYATLNEEEGLIAELILSDHGVVESKENYSSYEQKNELTPEEFARLKSLQQKYPQAEVSVCRVWDYRDAEEDDPPEKIDSDGEVRCNFRTIAEIRFTVGPYVAVRDILL